MGSTKHFVLELHYSGGAKLWFKVNLFIFNFSTSMSADAILETNQFQAQLKELALPFKALDVQGPEY